MRYHDFHIEGYSVSKFGEEIVFNLIVDYPDRAKVISTIKFSDVVVYHFVHTGGAIMTEIEEVSIDSLFKSVGDQLAEWWRMHGGFRHWTKGISEYQVTLELEGYKGWLLDSAIGFAGFVVAKSVQEVTA